MAARAMWKGTIKLGSHALPVKLYAAVNDPDVHFHLLHERDGVRVEQRIVSSETGEPVDKTDIRKGYAIESGRFVILEPKDIEKIAPEPTRDIEIDAFIPARALPPPWFERPYYLAPDGSAEEYAALVRALEREDRQGVVRWVMRKRQYHGALRRHGDRLVLITLRHRDQVIDSPRVTVAPSRAPTKQELALAEQLISTLEGEFDPSQFKNEYRERVAEFVEQKAKGKQPRVVKPRAKKPAGASLESMLKASVKRARPAAPKTKERKSA